MLGRTATKHSLEEADAFKQGVRPPARLPGQPLSSILPHKGEESGWSWETRVAEAPSPWETRIRGGLGEGSPEQVCALLLLAAGHTLKQSCSEGCRRARRSSALLTVTSSEQSRIKSGRGGQRTGEPGVFQSGASLPPLRPSVLGGHCQGVDIAMSAPLIL